MITSLLLAVSLFHHHHKRHVPDPLDAATIQYCEKTKELAVRAFKDYPSLTGYAVIVYLDALVVEEENAESPTLATDFNSLVGDTRSLLWAEDAYDNRTRA